MGASASPARGETDPIESEEGPGRNEDPEARVPESGWDLGRDVYASDVAAEIERTPGLDYLEDLALTVDGVPQGESVRVGDEGVVAAGAIVLRLDEGEGAA